MKSFLKFLCEMPVLSNSMPIGKPDQRNVLWSTLLQKAKHDGFEYGTQSLKNLNGLGVTVFNGNGGVRHVVVNDEKGNPHGYLRITDRGDHHQISSMMKNPSGGTPLHSEILHHLSRELGTPIVSDYKQTEGAMKFWNRVARTHGGVSLIKKGQQVPYDPNVIPGEEVWGEGEDQQDTLLSVDARRKQQ